MAYSLSQGRFRVTRDFSIKPSPAAPTGDCFGFDTIYMRDELTPAVPGQMIAVDSEEVKEFRLPYRLMCYYLKTQEFTHLAQD